MKLLCSYLFANLLLPSTRQQNDHVIFESLPFVYITSRRVARIWKRGGGFFERVRKVQTTLTRIFTFLESVSHEKLGNQTFFQPKNKWSPKKKKKKVFTEMEIDFSPKIGNSNVFSAQKQVVSNRKKKVVTEIETDFSAIIGNSNAFSYRITRSTSQLRHPIFFGGAVFNFSAKIGLKSTKNKQFCISSPPLPPPGDATDYI